MVLKEMQTNLKSPRLGHSLTPSVSTLITRQRTPRIIRLVSEESPQQFTKTSVYQTFTGQISPEFSRKKSIYLKLRKSKNDLGPELRITSRIYSNSWSPVPDDLQMRSIKKLRKKDPILIEGDTHQRIESSLTQFKTDEQGK